MSAQTFAIGWSEGGMFCVVGECREFGPLWFNEQEAGCEARSIPAVLIYMKLSLGRADRRELSEPQHESKRKVLNRFCTFITAAPPRIS